MEIGTAAFENLKKIDWVFIERCYSPFDARRIALVTVSYVFCKFKVYTVI